MRIHSFALLAAALSLPFLNPADALQCPDEGVTMKQIPTALSTAGVTCAEGLEVASDGVTIVVHPNVPCPYWAETTAAFGEPAGAGSKPGYEAVQSGKVYTMRQDYDCVAGECVASGAPYIVGLGYDDYFEAPCDTPGGDPNQGGTGGSGGGGS